MFGSGIISGLDTRSIVNQLTQIERQPAIRLQQKQSTFRSQISDLGNLSSLMSDLKNSLQDLQDVSGVLAASATSSNEDILQASASGSAAQGRYSVTVEQLARSEKNLSANFADAQAEVREGTLTIGVYGEDAVDVELTAGMTLAEARDAIASSGAKVNVSIIQTGSGAQLSITSQKTGYDPAGEGGIVDPAAGAGSESDALTLTESYTGSSGGALSMVETQSAQNAIVEIDTLRIGHTDNSATGILEGVTLELQTAQPGEVVDLRVEPSDDEVVERLKGFMDSYNALMDGLSLYGEKDKSFAQRVETELRTLVAESVPGFEAQGLSNLSSLGFATNFETGRLDLTESDLRDALAADPGAVAGIFALDTDGVVDRMTRVLDLYTDPIDGVIETSKDSLNSRIDSLDTSIERINRRADQFSERLSAQFNSLETQLASISDISNQFSSFLPALAV
ncbi:MAG: flagellar filament capping protein FliD, partial [Myxococcota bacterium]